MKKIMYITLLLLSVSVFLIHLIPSRSGIDQQSITSQEKIHTVSVASQTGETERLYQEMNLDNLIDYDMFKKGMEGYGRIDSKNKNILALIDFSKPSTEERLYVLDLDKQELLFVSHVSHGRNSGDNYATSFSNVNGSYQSSLGFYVTENTYQGKNGYSLVMQGLEKGINDRAKERAIVMHGAPYSNPSVIASNGRLGRSLGCPAVPEVLARPIIDTLKEGAVIFIYAGDKEYHTQSTFLS